MGAFTSKAVREAAPSCWFPLSHVEAMMAHSEINLCAVCDVNETAIQAVLDLHSSVRAYRNLLPLLEQEKPKLLGIATRTPGRAEVIKAAFAAGVLGVHTEKPLCNSVAELKELENVLGKPDTFLTWGAIRRFLGPYCRALQIAQSGKYGKILQARAGFGLSPLFWVHPHSIDLLLLCASGSPIDSVTARLGNLENSGKSCIVLNDPVVLCASIFFRNGFIGHITQSAGCDFTIVCEGGEVVVRADGHALEIYSSRNSPYSSHHNVDYVSGAESPRSTGSLAPISHLVSCLRGLPYEISKNERIKRDVLLSQRISFAFLQSHLERGAPVGIEDIDPDMEIKAITSGRPA